MRNVQANQLCEVSAAILAACAAPDADAVLVAKELVEANLMGIDSHGVIRIPQYVEAVRRNEIVPGAPVCIELQTAGAAVVDCAWNFGIVAAHKILEIAEEMAQSQAIACVTSHHAHHVGRLGAYVQRLAERGFVSLAVANGARSGHWVTPWGGREGRLATNPLAFGAPGDPIVLDMSTSMISEGKIRLLAQQGTHIPSGCILDAHGCPTTDPEAFYGPPMGTILPFGGALGYKGFGLSLMVEILGSTLGGTSVPPDGAPNTYLNGFTVIVFHPDAFSDRFVETIDKLCAYITSCPPATDSSGVVMPGGYDFAMRKKRLAEGIPIAENTWEALRKTAASLCLSI